MKPFYFPSILDYIDFTVPTGEMGQIFIIWIKLPHFAKNKLKTKSEDRSQFGPEGPLPEAIGLGARGAWGPQVGRNEVCVLRGPHRGRKSCSAIGSGRGPHLPELPFPSLLLLGLGWGHTQWRCQGHVLDHQWQNPGASGPRICCSPAFGLLTLIGRLRSRPCSSKLAYWLFS